ncbi:8-oxo-dGTP diphosphatase [Sporothrix epigloea]|uniref:8-oxo-dGTP diphosphatase n=1 Tax=Sporothrix epigloea TaxID=1892477 RepID=A0ABP0E2R1_9PEZI
MNDDRAGRIAVTERPVIEDIDVRSTSLSNRALSSGPALDLPLEPAEVADLTASIQAASSESLRRSSSQTSSDPDLDADPDVTRVNLGDDSYYWDPSTMAPLNARSVAAIARLRAFRPPLFSLWDRLPVHRRAAVLVLLYADRRGDLRVVLTMRAAGLRNFSGHAAFPGGKADSLDETAEQIARREAWEEIGLPMDDAKLPRPFRIEHLCDLPYNLAKTELVVRPCVALLHRGEGDSSADRDHSAGAGASTSDDGTDNDVTPDEALLPKLNASEVAAVFSAPFHNFLLPVDEVDKDDGTPLALTQSKPDNLLPQRRPALPPGPWYEGSWVHWHEEPWRMHFFYVPVVGQHVAKPQKRARVSGGGTVGSSETPDESTATAAAAPEGAADTVTTFKEDEQKDEDGTTADEVEDAPGRYKVWGMTARILVDAAKLAYGETPAFEHNSHFGDERMIEGLEKMGRLGEKKRLHSELTHEDLKEASKM